MLAVKHLHILFVTLSLSGFLLRAGWRLRRGTRLTGRWARTVPDVVDTGLFLSGLTMVLHFHWSPLRQPWLLAKLIALVLYIVLGAIALRRGSLPAALAAVATFGYIVSVAVTKHPFPF